MSDDIVERLRIQSRWYITLGASEKSRRVEDEAADEIERLQTEVVVQKCRADAMAALAVKMELERNAMRADAERYRWLKANMVLGVGQNGAFWQLTSFDTVAPDSKRDIDAAIDAARGGKE